MKHYIKYILSADYRRACRQAKKASEFFTRVMHVNRSILRR